MTKNDIRTHLYTPGCLIDVHTHVGADPAQYRRGDFPYAQSAEDLLVRMERWDLGAAVCFPFLYTAYFDLEAFCRGSLRPSDSASCSAPYAAENEQLCREIYEAYPAATGRLFPFMFFDPSRAQSAQVENLERLTETYPIFGLKTATSYLQSPIADLLAEGACILDFAARRNLPLMVHTAVMPGDPWANVHAALEVARARPDVRFCLAHTCRFDRLALEAADALPNCFVDFSAFNIHGQLARQNHPAVAAPENRFPADYRRHAAAMAAIAEAFPDTMLWGSDAPFYCFMSRFIDESGKTATFQLQCGTDTEITEFRKLPPKVQVRLAHDNTVKFLFGENQ